MSDIDPTWTVLGRTDNATFHAASSRVIVVVPDAGCTDDENTARQSIQFQRDHWRANETTGTAIIMMDRVSNQTREARRVYQSETEIDTETINGFALISSSMFGRAVASVFMGLARPPVPTRMFADVPEALKWAHSLNAEADER